MNSIIKFFILIIIACSIFSCTSQKEKSIIDEDDIFIPDSLFDFYPDDPTYFAGTHYIETNARKKYNNSLKKAPLFIDSYYIKAQLASDMNSFNKLIREYKKEAIDSIKSTDTCYFIVSDEEEMLQSYNQFTLIENYKKARYILPRFHNYISVNYNKALNDSLTISGLPKGYEILIMKSGKDFILPENRKFDWNILPSNLKHGYTSGIAFRKSYEMIIYWSVAW